jgi:hypothetical protein
MILKSNATVRAELHYARIEDASNCLQHCAFDHTRYYQHYVVLECLHFGRYMQYVHAASGVTPSTVDNALYAVLARR